MKMDLKLNSSWCSLLHDFLNQEYWVALVRWLSLGSFMPLDPFWFWENLYLTEGPAGLAACQDHMVAVERHCSLRAQLGSTLESFLHYCYRQLISTQSNLEAAAHFPHYLPQCLSSRMKDTHTHTHTHTYTHTQPYILICFKQLNGWTTLKPPHG